MAFERSFLEGLLKDTPWGDFPLLGAGSKGTLRAEEHYRKLVRKLENARFFEAEADFDHFGSGYASFISVSLWKRNGEGVSYEPEANSGRMLIRKEGLLLYLCRLAPYAALGPSTWYEWHEEGRKTGGMSEFLEAEKVGSWPEEEWSGEIRELEEILGWYSISLLTREELEPVLDFPVSLETNLSNPPYRVFDCFFHWMD